MVCGAGEEDGDHWVSAGDTWLSLKRACHPCIPWDHTVTSSKPGIRRV